MSTSNERLLAALLLVTVAAVSGCSRKSGDNAGTESAAPAPEVVMPETNTPAVETAPTLAPEPTTTTAAGTTTVNNPVTPEVTPVAATSSTSTATTPPAAATPSAAAPTTATPPAASATDPLLSIAQSKATTIDSGIAGYTMRNQPQVIGDVRSDISIYSSAGKVVYIEEKQTTSDNSISTNKYYFDNGKLFYYQDDGRWLDVNPPNPLATRNTHRSMAFTAGGKLITAAKTVDSAPASVSEYEAVAVLTRAEQLLGPLPTAAAAAEKTVDKTKTETVATAKTGTSNKEKDKDKNREPAKAETPAASNTETGSSTEAGSHVNVATGNENKLSGSAPAHGTRDFVVHARAGQLLTLSLNGGSSTTFAVYSSRGEIVSDLTNWSSKLPRDGDYTIKVGQKAGSAPADFTLNLKLE